MYVNPTAQSIIHSLRLYPQPLITIVANPSQRNHSKEIDPPLFEAIRQNADPSSQKSLHISGQLQAYHGDAQQGNKKCDEY
jgi:hypothetical protein